MGFEPDVAACREPRRQVEGTEVIAGALLEGPETDLRFAGQSKLSRSTHSTRNGRSQR